MNSSIRFSAIFLLGLVFFFAFQKSSRIQVLKRSIPENSISKDDLYTISDLIGQNGSGKELRNAFPDSKLISSDPLGVGSGPIDYLYSQKADTTFFYSRYFDSVISFKKGKLIYTENNKTSYNQ